MTGSYKIALLAAALLCALVVGYYVMPASDDADVSADDAAASADESAAAPRSLLRSSPTAPSQASRQPGRSRTGGQADEMTPFGEPTSPSAGDDQLPPSEDPGLAAADEGNGGSASDAPVLPVGRDARSLQSNPFEPVDVASAADEAESDTASAADESDAASPDLSRALIISERHMTREPEPTAAAADEPATRSAPASREASSPRPSAETYTVQSGDTLSSIASKLYGAERHWVDIARANPRVDPIRLRIGQELRLPDRDTLEQRSSDEDLETPPGTLTHTVRPGETLSTIAQQYYNSSSRWRVIFNANRDLLGSDPDRVTAGDELTIPPLPRN